MVKTSGSLLCQQHSPWETSTFGNSMISSVEHRQHEFLPVYINPQKISSNLGLNGLGSSGLPERGLTVETNELNGKYEDSRIPLFTQNRYLEEHSSLSPERFDEKQSTYDAPHPQQKSFLIFDQSGKETRICSSSLCPRFHDLTNAQTKYPAQEQANKVERACLMKPKLFEVSGEHEIVDEDSESHEDTDEINALLYSSSDDYDDDDDDEVSTGHSPLAMEQDSKKQEEEEEVASLDRCSKRQKALDGGQNQSYEKIQGGDLISAISERVFPTVGSKRPRKDNIRDTLKVLENIIPGVKSKDPLVILDEAISYLKCLKDNAEVK